MQPYVRRHVRSPQPSFTIWRCVVVAKFGRAHRAEGGEELEACARASLFGSDGVRVRTTLVTAVAAMKPSE